MLDPDLKSFVEELAEFVEDNKRTAPVYAERVCRYCGGSTVAARVLRVSERRGRALQGAPRQRFWCDECEKVTS